MTGNSVATNLFLLFCYTAAFGYLFKLYAFRSVRIALEASGPHFRFEELFAPGNRSNSLVAIVSFVAFWLPILLLIAEPDYLRLFVRR